MVQWSLVFLAVLLGKVFLVKVWVDFLPLILDLLLHCYNGVVAVVPITSPFAIFIFKIVLLLIAATSFWLLENGWLVWAQQRRLLLLVGEVLAVYFIYFSINSCLDYIWGVSFVFVLLAIGANRFIEYFDFVGAFVFKFDAPLPAVALREVHRHGFLLWSQ